MSTRDKKGENERYRRRRSARGQCLTCPNEAAMGRQCCQECLDALGERARLARSMNRAAGRCVMCGKPARPGSWHCEAHLEARKLQNWRQRERLRDAVGDWPRRVRAIRARVRTLRRLLALRTNFLQGTYVEPFY